MGFFNKLFGRKEKTKHDDTSNSEATKDTQQSDPKEAQNHYHISMNRDEKSENHGMWRVRMEHSDKTIKHFKTQKAAIEYAKTLAESAGVSIVIHKLDGSMRKQQY